MRFTVKMDCTVSATMGDGLKRLAVRANRTRRGFPGKGILGWISHSSKRARGIAAFALVRDLEDS